MNPLESGAWHAPFTLEMPMQKITPAANPDAYVAALTGWHRTCVESLRAATRGAAALEEVIKWGHVVYLSGGPVLYIRAEGERVLFGFWRGQRLMTIEPRLVPGGKYEMATIWLNPGDAVKPEIVRKLVKTAAALNKTIGNPIDDAKPGKKKIAKKAGAKKKAPRRPTTTKAPARAAKKTGKKRAKKPA